MSDECKKTGNLCLVINNKLPIFYSESCSVKIRGPSFVMARVCSY